MKYMEWKWVHIKDAARHPDDRALDPIAFVIPARHLGFVRYLFDSPDGEVVIDTKIGPATLYSWDEVYAKYDPIILNRLGLIRDHPLVPEEWHGLGYRPLADGEAPEEGTFVFVRGVRDRKLVESLGRVGKDTSEVYVRLFDEYGSHGVIHFDGGLVVRGGEAVFEVHPIEYPWGADQ